MLRAPGASARRRAEPVVGRAFSLLSAFDAGQRRLTLAGRALRLCTRLGTPRHLIVTSCPAVSFAVPGRRHFLGEA